jgi:hypothetical protein
MQAVPIAEAVKCLRTVPEGYYNMAKTFFGW